MYYTTCDTYVIILTYSLSIIDTVILHNGIARLWSFSAVQPVDGSSKGFTVLENVGVVISSLDIKYSPSSTHMLIVTGKKMAELSIPLGSPVFAVVVHLAEFGAPSKAGILLNICLNLSLL